MGVRVHLLQQGKLRAEGTLDDEAASYIFGELYPAQRDWLRYSYMHPEAKPWGNILSQQAAHMRWIAYQSRTQARGIPEIKGAFIPKEQWRIGFGGVVVTVRRQRPTWAPILCPTEGLKKGKPVTLREVTE